MSRVNYNFLKDGQREHLLSRRHKLRCCDCGLVHDIEFRISKGKISFRAWRDNRATAAVRRHMKKK